MSFSAAPSSFSERINEVDHEQVDRKDDEVHPDAKILPNGTKYEYKILPDKKTKEERFYAYYSKEDIEQLRKDLFDIEEYHNEGGIQINTVFHLSLISSLKSAATGRI